MPSDVSRANLGADFNHQNTTMLSFAERERIAYITDSPEAALLILIEDALLDVPACGHASGHDMEMRIDELETELEMADVAQDDLAEQIIEALAKIVAIEQELAERDERINELELELYCATDKIMSMRNYERNAQ